MNYLIKKYFQEFESYHEVWVLKNSLFVWLIISLSLFLLGIILWLFVLNMENKEFEKLYMSLILLLEVLVLYLFYAIERQRNEIIKLKFQKIYKNKIYLCSRLKRGGFVIS
ncbi:fumarate reductase subunit D [Acinetobacter johnsonii]|nr:fumarate reductase subunit D [Acinetobacter johnsonii]